MAKNGNGNGHKSNGSKNGKPPLTNAKGQPICGARVRNCRKCAHKYPAAEYKFLECPECGELRPCQETKLYKNGKCYMHGGPSRGPIGVSPANYKHGLYRRVWKAWDADDMFTTLIERRDELLDPMDSLGSMQTRIITLAEGVAGSILLRELRKAWNQLRSAGGNKAKQSEALDRLEELIKRGDKEAEQWEEVWDLEEKANKLRYQIHKMEVERGLLVRLDFAMAMIGAHYNANKAIITARCTEVGEPGLAKLIIRQSAEALDSIVGGSGADAMRLGLAGRDPEDDDGETNGSGM